MARQIGLRLWMSEVDAPAPNDPENYDGMTSPLFFAQHIVGDLKHLEPAAWVMWQAVENESATDGRSGSHWGLVKTDLRAPTNGEHAIHVTRKYWAMAQFSRYILPGYRLVNIDDAHTAGAISPDGNVLTLVHVNANAETEQFLLPAGWAVARVLTYSAHNACCVAGDAVAPPRSIVTFVLTRGNGRRVKCMGT